MEKNGFTLTELLTTTAVIGVLASLMLPAISKVKHKARDVQCLNSQRNLKVGLEMAHSDSFPDFTSKYSLENMQELNRIFMRDHVGPIVADPYLGDVGVYVSKTMTCPYAFGRGAVRPSFETISIDPKHPISTATPPEAKYLAWTYDFSLDFLFPQKSHNNNFAVGDIPNYTIVNKETLVGEEIPFLKEAANRRITIDNSLLHPARGQGAYLTLGSGEQKWLSRKEIDR